jgi:hypothetical protein
MSAAELRLTAVPVPESGTASVGFTGSLLLILRTAVLAPPTVGLNVTLIVQFAPPATVAPQVFTEIAKSPAFAPESPMPLTVSGCVPVLDSVTVWAALVVFSSWLPNTRDDGDTPAMIEMPEPPSETASAGFTGSLLLTVRLADRAPTAVGVKVTLMVQFAAAARLAPQVFAEMAKSPAFAPVRPMLLIVSGQLPVLDSVTVWAALVVFSSWLP